MTVTIRSPARTDRRYPYMAVRAGFTPGAVIIQIAIADHVRGDIPGGNGGILATVTNAAPVIEAIKSRRVGTYVSKRGPIGKTHPFVLPNTNRGAIPGGIAFPLPHGYNTGIAIGIDVKPVHAGLLDGEGHVGRIHFVDLAAIQSSDPQI